jgi:hypothetical protein
MLRGTKSEHGDRCAARTARFNLEPAKSEFYGKRMTLATT